MLEYLKEKVWEANRRLKKENLVTLTWGNVSAYDEASGLVAIKPSGVEYDAMKPEDIVLTDLEGRVVEGHTRPSSDTPTHCYLYRHFKNVRSIVHTHSSWATVWSQSERSIPVFGTTHADYFHEDVPCTRKMTADEIGGEYEYNTGKVIVETFQNRNPSHTPGVLVSGHAPFVWGADVDEAVQQAVVLEEVAKMAYFTTFLKETDEPLDSSLIDKHYSRKHGKDAYYGQLKEE